MEQLLFGNLPVLTTMLSLLTTRLVSVVLELPVRELDLIPLMVAE